MRVSMVNWHCFVTFETGLIAFLDPFLLIALIGFLTLSVCYTCFLLQHCVDWTSSHGRYAPRCWISRSSHYIVFALCFCVKRTNCKPRLSGPLWFCLALCCVMMLVDSLWINHASTYWQERDCKHAIAMTQTTVRLQWSAPMSSTVSLYHSQLCI